LSRGNWNAATLAGFAASGIEKARIDIAVDAGLMSFWRLTPQVRLVVLPGRDA
jgi:hypothetical protein